MMKLKFGLEQTKAYQEYETLGAILSMALGGSKQKSKPVQSYEELAHKFEGIFGQGSVA